VAEAGPHLCDVTLRDGEQAADAAFTADEKVELVLALEALGVDEVQAGFAADAQLVASAKEAGARVPLQLLAPAFADRWRDELDRAADHGVDVIALLVRVSDRHLSQLGWDRAMAMERAVRAVAHVADAGVTPIVTASFATLADVGFVGRLAQAVAEVGARRLVLADTTGQGTPESIEALVAALRAATDLPLGIHCHDDFGLAVANTLVGLRAGAAWAEVSLTGIGERAGNAALEEVVMALRCLTPRPSSVHSERLVAVCGRVAAMLRRELSPNKAIVGRHAFAQKLDLHVRAALDDPALLEPFDPALAGNERSLRLGKGSGAVAVEAKLAELGLVCNDNDVRRLVALTNEQAERTKRAVPDEVLVDALSRVPSGRGDRR
jgi:isopropylmalate/homocitrate/citramalate synthase